MTLENWTRLELNGAGLSEGTDAEWEDAWIDLGGEG
jgi:hypothetical protein